MSMIAHSSFLRLVHQQAIPLDLGQRIDVTRCDVVRRDDDVDLAHLAPQLLVRETVGTVVKVHTQPRREPVHLRDPLPRDAHRAHDQCRPECVAPELLALRLEHRDRLHRLPEPHIVGENRADPEIAEHAQPAVPLLLEREQVVPHPRRRAARAEARVLAAEQLVE
jgi:hypothetical protein